MDIDQALAELSVACDRHNRMLDAGGLLPAPVRRIIEDALELVSVAARAGAPVIAQQEAERLVAEAQAAADAKPNGRKATPAKT